MKPINKKWLILYGLIAFGTYIPYSLENGISSIEDAKQILSNECFKNKKDLRADVTLKINNDDITCSIAFSSLGSNNGILKYVYTYNKKTPELMKIGLAFYYSNTLKDGELKPVAVESPQEQEEKKVEGIDTDLNKILNDLNPITFCDINFNCILDKDSEGLATVKLDGISNNLSQDKDKIEQVLQNIWQLKPDGLNKLSFLLYVTSLGLSKGQHEDIITKSD